MTGYNQSKLKISTKPQENQIEEICDQLNKVVHENYNFSIQTESQNESIQKLCKLINFIIHTAHHTLDSIQDRNNKLTQIGKLKFEFIANISHELRTPLTLILGPLESILEDKSTFSADNISNLERIQRNAYRLYVLINDLLDFSKLEAGIYAIHNEVVDINANIAQLIDKAQGLAKEKKITLEFINCPSIKCIYIDSKMLEKIILNLISNALKFTPMNGKVILELKNLERCFQIIVSDTGLGIPASQIETLFENFCQVESLHTRVYKGSGIGLTIVKQFCELMGGNICVDSQENKGSKFTLTFALNPFMKNDDSKATKVKSIHSGSSITSHAILSALSEAEEEISSPVLERKLPLILIVDDNKDLRSFIRSILIKSYEIMTAKNGKEALDAIYRYHPQIVLSDVTMPIMNGFQLIQAIKADPKIHHTPVILITAKNENESVASCLSAGADDYLTKPFSSDELLSRIDATLRVYNTLHTLANTQEELKAALFEAEKSTKAKSLFLANMSHEIRTPLNGVMGMLQLLLHTSLDKKQNHYVNKSIEAANSLLKILGDILDFSKIESGLTSIELIAFDLKTEIDALIAMFSVLCSQKNIHLELKYDDNIPSQMIGDPTRIKQVIVNLVNNAIKFTPLGGTIKLHISLDSIRARTDSDKKFAVIQIAVIDTGIGIAQDAQAKIFDKFTQADESTTRKYGGTGLGLAIAKELVELMGGKIQVNSTIDVGTTFLASLLLEIAHQDPNPQHQKEDKRSIESIQAHILLAEDNELNQMVACELLNILGCTIDVVHSGEDAIHAALNKKYDLIFMDCQMPGMDALTATRKIREHEKLHPDKQKSIIVALTTSALKETREKCIDIGMNDYLAKPFVIDDLVKVLRKYVLNNHS